MSLLTLGLICAVAEGGVVKRQSYFRQQYFQQNNTQFPFQPGQFQPGQFQPGQFQPGQFQPGQFGGQNLAGFLPAQQQQQQQQQQGQRADAPLAASSPSSSSPPIPIVKLDIQPNLGDGKYQYSYETGNGISAEEKGSQKAVGEPAEEGTVAQGSYSYTDPEGNLISVTYIADENGFQPQGSHLPTPPPVPAEILAALEQSAAEEASQTGGVVSPSYHLFLRGAHNRYRYY